MGTRCLSFWEVIITREYEKRDKKVHKMTRDGLVERNLATGEDTRISGRGQDFDLRQAREAPDTGASVRQAISESREHRRPRHTSEIPEDSGYGDTIRQEEAPERMADPTPDTPGQSFGEFTETPYHLTDTPARDIRRTSPSGDLRDSTATLQRRAQNKAAYRNHADDDRRLSKDTRQTESPDRPAAPEPEDLPDVSETAVEQPDHDRAREDPAGQRGAEKSKKTPLSERRGRLRFDDTHGEFSEAKSRQHGTKYQRRFTEEQGSPPPDTPASGDTAAGKLKAETPIQSKPDKLRFTADETPPGATPSGKKLKKAQYKAEHSAARLEAAKQRLPKKHSVKVERNFDPESGKPKRRLLFEEEVKTQTEHLKGSKPMRPVKAGAGAVGGYVHKKIREVEHENVGVEAAHKGERLVEGGLHRAYRFHKTRPYRRVAKLERQTSKRAAEHAWQKALHDNPRLQSNLLSRMAQKRKLKRQYAKAAQEAKRAKQTAQKAGSLTARAAKAVTGFVRRHPLLIGGAALILLVVFLFSSLFVSCSNMAGGGFSTTIMSSYTAEDEDVLAADADYTRLETELQAEIDSIESDYPGYDEYRYSLAQIGHDPYELASYLTAVYFDYTPAEVAAELQAIFDRQYTLTVTEIVEVRYRTETRTDSEGNSYTVRVAYNYFILSVTLENRAVSGVAAMNLDAEQMEMYSLYMETKGNKPDLFGGGIYAGGYTGGSYTDYDIPREALSDADFAAMIKEAEKYLGYPYVWGGSSPSTSFDCSGFVCWVLNQSGVASVGRTTASGLYNMSAIVSASEAKPGDLIFFQGTYNTSGASHVGIYVGNGMMIHCGNPISYTSIETSYWQSHFLAFGRIH